MAKKVIAVKDLKPQQSKAILEKLNQVSATELSKIIELAALSGSPKKIAAAILQKKKELSAFSDAKQLLEIKGIGPKEFSLLAQALLLKPVSREKLLTPGDVTTTISKRVLEFLNTAPNAKFIARSIEIPGLRDIGVETADKIISFRNEKGNIKTLAELDNIPGIGQKRFTDIVNALKHYPLPAQLLTPETVSTTDAGIVLKKLNQAKNPAEIDALINTPLLSDVGSKLSESIYLAKLELAGFKTLADIDKIPGIGPAKFTSIVMSLTKPVDSFPVAQNAVVKKTTLAQFLQFYLTPEDKNRMIIGTDAVFTAVEKLSAALPPRQAQYLNSIFSDALKSKVINGETSVADLVYFPHIATNITLSSPRGIIDPASLPEISPDIKWFKTRGVSFYQFEGPATIEILTASGWSREITLNAPIAFQPVKEGMVVRNVVIEGGQFYEPSSLLFAPAPAFRITCRGGVRGKLTFKPRNLDDNDAHVAHVPPDWFFPGNEVWINPINSDFLPKPQDPPRPHGTLPERVVIGGGSTAPGATGTGGGNEEDEEDHVFIGSQVFIVKQKPLPWPWGPGPWPPWPFGPDPSPGRNGLYDAPPRIYGEEIDTDMTVQATGCECIRKNETEEYVAHPAPEGGSYKWVVEDDDIAEIQGPDDQKSVELKGLDIGKTTLTLKYSKDSYEASFEMGISVIYQQFTMKDQPRAEILTVPLIQPSPSVRISSIDTRPKVDSVNLERHKAKFKFRIDGLLKDPLIEITSVKVCAANGFEVDLPKEETEKGKFDDNMFFANDVEITGPGRSYIRVIAKNTISFVGTDTAQVVTKLKATDEERIRQLEHEWAEAKDDGEFSVIEDKRKALETAWENALKNVEVEVGYLTHTDNTVQEAPGEHKWSVSVEDDVKMGMVKLQNTIDGHDLVLEEEEEKLIAPEEDPTNYFLLHQNYGERDELTWNEDGKMLGEAGTPMQLIYLADCCGHDAPIIGVEFEKKPGIQFIKKNESIRLEAKGKPESFESMRGIYHWKVAAHPAGAVFRFEPADPTIDKVNFFTDTPGVYTFRVDYELAGMTSPWTYALCDAQIVFKVKTVPRLFRLGQYDGEMAKHLDRPYYAERSHKPQRGAEIMIYNSESGPIGQEMKVTVLCPMELTLSDTIKARAFFADDTFRDYPLYVDGQFNFMAEAEIISAQVIQRLYIIDIQYGDLQRYKGDAVWIDVRVRPLAPVILDLDEGLAAPTVTTPAPSANGTADATAPEVINLEAFVKIAINEDENISVTNETWEDIQPRVNLLLYNRDLGVALPSRGFETLSNSGECHNLPNGNFYIPVPIIESRCHGISTSVSLSYNSLQAIFQDSLELFRLMNGIKQTDIEKYYCPNPLGKGWTHNYNIYVRDYIKPGPTYATLIFYVEVVTPDGNRIQMKISDSVSPGTDGLGDYNPEFKSDHFLGAAEFGHSLVLTKSKNQDKIEYLLKDIHGHEWKFDDQGRLVEIHNRLTRNSNTKPLLLEYGNTFVKIKDSVERETEINFLQPGGDTTLLLQTPDGETSLISYSQGLLTEMMLRGGSQTWSFEYETNFLQISSIPTSLIKKVTEPEGVVIEAEYYDGKEFRGVKEEIAKDFWGKLGRTQKDAGEDGREHLWRYEAYGEENQKLIYTNPEKIEFAITFQRTVMAVTARSYIKQEVDDITKKLKGTPNYQQVLDGEIQQLEEVVTENYTYFNNTKLVEKYTDLQANETKYGYWQIPGREAYILNKITSANGVVHEFEIDPGTNLVEKAFNPYKTSQGVFTKYTYNNLGALKERTFPALDSAAPDDVLKETFEYDPDSGQLKSNIQVNGLEISYSYYDSGRDDDRTGVSTGKSIKLTKGQPAEKMLAWETSYDKMGNVLSSYEPVYGGTMTVKYKKMQLLEEVTHQKIPTHRGMEESEVVQFTYNNLHQRRTRINNIAGETWEYNNHGEVVLYTDRNSASSAIKFDKTGRESQVTDASGAMVEYIRDELGRVSRINYPMPDMREATKKSEGFTDVYTYNDKNRTSTRQRFLVASPGGAVGELSSEQITLYEHGKVKSITRCNKPGNQVVKTECVYGPFGDVTETLVYDNDSLKQKVTIVQDNWGRTIEDIESDGTRSRTATTVFDAASRVIKVIPPAPTGVQASQSIDYDELGRPFQFKDSYDVVTKEYRFFDYGNSDDTSPRHAYMVCKEQDPSAPEAQNRLLLKSRTDQNKRGLAFITYLKKDQSVTDAQLTAADVTPILDKLYTSETQYDSLCRRMKEVKFTGTTQEYAYDSLDRIREIKSSQITRRPDIPFDQLDANNPAHFTMGSEYTQYIYHVNGQAKEIHEQYGSQINEFDILGRVIKVFDQPFGNPRQLKEEITYDVHDRPRKRFFRNNKRQEFEYRDATRAVLITSENSTSKVITESMHDWEGKILSFKYLENLQRNPAVFGAFKRVSLQFQYGNFAKLKSKSYFDGNDLLGSIEYDYDDANLRSKTKLSVRRSNGTTFQHETIYRYDANLRMTELSSGGSTSRYVFQYNAAGIMKMMGRPSIATSTSSPFGNATVYEHDQNGLLTKMVEEKGLHGSAVKLSELDFYYQRPQPETWETQTPATFQITNVDTLQSNPYTLKRLRYRRFFNEQGANDRDIYTQDYAYDSNGQTFAAVTRHLDAARNEVFVDSRYTDGMNAGSQHFTRKQFRRFDYPNIYETTRKNFTDALVTVYGYPNLVVSRLGARPAGAPKLFPKNYLTQNIYDADHLLKEEYSLEENFDPSLDARLYTEGRQIHKFYYHNALDQLMVTIDRTENRQVSTTFAPHVTNAEDQSMNNTTWHQYGADGAAIFRSLSYWEQPQPGGAIAKNSETFILSDGPCPVVEYNKTEGILRHYHIVPGVNVRLEAHTSFDNSTGTTGFYRTDHRGSTIFLTDLYGEVKTDFNYKSNDGQSDLFGLTNAPRAIGHSLVTPQMLTEHLSYYLSAGPRLDISMCELAGLEANQERLQVLGQAPDGVQNPYGYSSGKPYVFIDTDLILKTEYGPEGVRMREKFLSLDHLQLGLDVLGLIPVVGEVFDVANGAIHLLRGNKAEAALSFMAMVPFIGAVATAAKLGGAVAVTGAMTAFKVSTGAAAVAGATKVVSAIGGVGAAVGGGAKALIGMALVGMTTVAGKGKSFRVISNGKGVIQTIDLAEELATGVHKIEDLLNLAKSAYKDAGEFHQVYRLLGSSDEILYYGISGEAWARNVHHLADKMGMFKKMEIIAEGLPSVRALQLETLLIQQQKLLFLASVPPMKRTAEKTLFKLASMFNQELTYFKRFGRDSPIPEDLSIIYREVMPQNQISGFFRNI